MGATDIVVADAGVDDLTIVAGALEGVEVSPLVTANAEAVRAARALVLAGHASFHGLATALHERGLDAAILHAVAHGAWLLGIGTGMQVLVARGAEGIPEDAPVAHPLRATPNGIGLPCGTVYEYGGERWVRGLGIFRGSCERRVDAGGPTPIRLNPAVQNDGDLLGRLSSAVGKVVDDELPGRLSTPYAIVGADEQEVLVYSGEVPVMLAQERVIGCQFDPEDTGELGHRLLRTFVSQAESR